MFSTGIENDFVGKDLTELFTVPVEDPFKTRGRLFKSHSGGVGDFLRVSPSRDSRGG